MHVKHLISATCQRTLSFILFWSFSLVYYLYVEVERLEHNTGFILIFGIEVYLNVMTSFSLQIWKSSWFIYSGCFHHTPGVIRARPLRRRSEERRGAHVEGLWAELDAIEGELALTVRGGRGGFVIGLWTELMGRWLRRICRCLRRHTARWRRRTRNGQMGRDAARDGRRMRDQVWSRSGQDMLTSSRDHYRNVDFVEMS